MKRGIAQFTVSLLYPLADVCVVALSIMASYKVYRILNIGQSVVYQKLDINSISLLIAIASIILLDRCGVYKQESSVLNVEEIRNTIKGMTAAYVCFMVIMVFGKYDLSRYVIFSSYLMSLICLIIEKTVIYHLCYMSKGVRELHKRILIYGAGELGQTLYREIINSPKYYIKPVGFIDDNPEKMERIIYHSGFHNNVGIRVMGSREDIPNWLNIWILMRCT